MNLLLSDKYLQELQIDDVSHDHILHLIKLGNRVEKLLTKYPPGIDCDEENKTTTSELSDVKMELLRMNMLLGGGTKKGKIAEKIVIKNLHRHFPDAEIDDTGYEFGKGDIVINYQGWKIMLEIKNYDGRSVNKDELQKFHRDLMQNNYDAGILLSCRSGIVSKKNKFIYETVDDKLSVYLSNAGSDGYSLIWAILFVVSSLNMVKNFKIDREKFELIHICVEKKLINIRRCIEHIETASKNLFNMKTNIIKNLNNGVKSVEIILDTTKQNLIDNVEDFMYLLKTGRLKSSVYVAEESKEIVVDVEQMSCKELKELCQSKGIKKYSGKTKKEMIELIGSLFKKGT